MSTTRPSASVAVKDSFWLLKSLSQFVRAAALDV
jgi:hypothetical protein